MPPKLHNVVAKLSKHYGAPKPPITTDAFELILFESVAYLVSDDRRLEAFTALRESIGTKPNTILTAPREKLVNVAAIGGIHPEHRARRIKEIALIALNEFAGDLSSVLKLPLPKAKKALQQFPSVGEPGAQKILLFTRSYPVLGLESNGLRVLLRLGFGAEKKNYTASYASVQEAIKGQLPNDYDWLIDAHLLLRQHGKELCKTNRPLCEKCPVKSRCEYFARTNTSGTN